MHIDENKNPKNRSDVAFFVSMYICVYATSRPRPARQRTKNGVVACRISFERCPFAVAVLLITLLTNERNVSLSDPRLVCFWYRSTSAQSRVQWTTKFANARRPGSPRPSQGGRPFVAECKVCYAKRATSVSGICYSLRG